MKCPLCCTKIYFADGYIQCEKDGCPLELAFEEKEGRKLYRLLRKGRMFEYLERQSKSFPVGVTLLEQKGFYIHGKHLKNLIESVRKWWRKKNV